MYITTVRRAVFAIGVGVDIGTDADVYQTRLSQGFLAGVVCVCVCVNPIDGWMYVYYMYSEYPPLGKPVL